MRMEWLGAPARHWSEKERVEVLARLGILDTPPETQFDTIVDCARRLFGVPIALIGLSDEHRHWFKARCGIDATEVTRDGSFCSWVVETGESLFVADAAADPRFAGGAMVAGPPFARFYAGVPLCCGHAADGAPVIVGTMCLIDREVRDFVAEERSTLERLAALASNLLQARLTAFERTELSYSRGQALAASYRLHQRFHKAEQLVDVGNWRLDLATGAVEWSEHTFTIFGLPPADTAPDLDTVLNFYPVRDRELLMQAIDRAIVSGVPYDLETDIVAANGVPRRIRNVGEVDMSDHEPVALIGVAQDVTERHEAEKALERSARVDELTQIGNRAALHVFLDERLAENGAGAPAPTALLLIDLDNFKPLNDTYGHAAGDDVLREVAAKLDAWAKRGGFAARLGGDEFVLVLTGAAMLADLRGAIADLLDDLRVDVVGDQGNVCVAATIGGAWVESDVRTRPELLKRADLALYGAKALGKGRGLVSGDLRPINRNSLPPTGAAS